MSEQAQISFSKNGLSLELSGSEQFVTEQMAIFQEAIIAALVPSEDETIDDGTSGPIDSATGTSPTDPPAATAEAGAQSKQYPNALYIEGNTVRILRKLPGSTTAKKAVATALVYLWAKRSTGMNAVSFREIREVCKNQGCLDAANFSANMKAARQSIVIEGARGSSVQTCKLTDPGVKQAEELLETLNAS